MHRLTILLFFSITISTSSKAQFQSISQPQYFEINITRDTLIETRKGAKIKIPAYSVDIRNIDPNAEYVKFAIEEAYEKVEMVLSNLTTETKRNLLLSDGMIKIEAALNGIPLELSAEKQLTVSLPTIEGVDTEMKLYSQNEEDGFWVKQKNRLRFDSCELIINRIVWDYREASKREYKKWKRKTPEENKPQVLFGGKSIDLFSSSKKKYHIPIPIDTIWRCAVKDTAYYRFNIQSMGWYNIDKIKKVKKPVSVKVKEKREVRAYLILKNEKVCLSGRKRNELINFKAINKNSRIAIVCYEILENGEVSFFIEEMRVDEDVLIEVDEFSETSLEDFKKRFRIFR